MKIINMCVATMASLAFLPAQQTQFVQKETFQFHLPQGLGITGPVVTGDVDNSGYPDVIMVSWGRAVLWLDPWSMTNTQLQNPTVAISAADRRGLALMDQDGDGNLDLITGYTTTSVAYGNGDGTFQPSVVWHSGGIGSLAAWGDVNGDGLLDTVSAMGTTGWPGVNVLGEIRVSNPSAPPTRTTLNFSVAGGAGSYTQPAGPGQNGIAIGNLNDDGADDMIFMRGRSNQLYGIELVMGSASGSFSQPQVLLTPWQSNYQSWSLVDKGDIDGDGRMDLLLSTDLGHAVLFGHPTLGLGAIVDIPSSYPAGFFRQRNARLADCDSDGQLDIAFTVKSYPGGVTTEQLHLIRGLGNRMFGAQPIADWVMSGISHTYRLQLALGDLDQDGDLDFFLNAADGLTPPFDTHCFLVNNRSKLGGGCAGVAGIPASQAGQATPGNQNFEISTTGAAPNSIAVALMSLGLAPLASGCDILVDTNALIAPSGGYGFVQTDASGKASLPVPLPGGPALLGLTLYTQWAVIDATSSFTAFGIPFAMSGAGAIRIY